MEDEKVATNASLEALHDSVKEDESESDKLEISEKSDEGHYDVEEGFIEFALESNSTRLQNEESVDSEAKNKQLQHELGEAIQALEVSELEKEALKLDSSITKGTLQQTAQEYEDLKLRHNELQNHMSDAEEKYSSQISVLREKIAENQKLDDALSSTADELARVQEELGVSQSLTSELVEKLSSKEADFSGIAQELALKEALESQLKEDISSLASQLGSVMENLNAKVSELDDIKLRLLEEASLRETVQASLKAQEDHVSMIYEELEKLVEEKKELEGTKAALRSSSNAAVEEAHSQVRELEARYVAIEQRNLELEQQQNLAELKSAEAERKLKEIGEQVIDLNSKLSASEEEKSLLTAQLDELKNRIEFLESSMEQTSARNAELESELKDNLVKCGEYEDSVNITRQRSLELEDIVQTSYVTMEDATKRISELELLLDVEKSRIQEVEDQWEKKYAEAKSEFDELKAKSSDQEIAIEMANEREKELVEGLKSRTEASKILEDELNSARAMLAEGEKLVALLRDELNVTREKLDAIGSDLQASGVREDELWNKLKSAEEELELHEKLLDKATLEKSELESSRSFFVHDSEMKFQEAIERLNEKDSELEQVLLRLAAMESERIELQKKIKKAENKILQVSSDNELLVHTNMQLKIRVNEIEELLKSSTEEKNASAKQLISDYEARILGSEQELQEITRKFTIRDTEANELLEKVSILEKQIKRYEAKVNEASALAEIRKAALEENFLKLTNAERAAEELKAMLAGSDELKAQISSLSEEKRLLSESYEGAMKELEALKIQLDEVISKASEENEVKSREFEEHVKKSQVTPPASTLEIQTHPAGLSPAATLKFVLGVALVSVIVGIILGKRY